MTMQFRTIKAALVDRIESQASTLGYRVVGYSENNIDAAQLAGDERLVQCFAKSGRFDRTKSAILGPFHHEVSFRVELLASAVCTVDTSILESETASDADRAAALAASVRAAKNADDSFDELLDAIWSTLMDNRYRDLEMPGEVADMYVSDWEKGASIDRGRHVVVPGRLTLTIAMSEDCSGSTPATPVSGEAVTVAINASANTDGTPQEGTAVTAGG